MPMTFSKWQNQASFIMEIDAFLGRDIQRRNQYTPDMLEDIRRCIERHNMAEGL